MKKINFLFFALAIYVLVGCGGEQVRNKNSESAAIVFFPLCEKAKSRITDLKRVSFDLPKVLQASPCQNWPDYSYNRRSDSIEAELPGVIANEKVKSVGSVLSLKVSGGYEQSGYYLSPDIFYEDYREYLRKRMKTYRLVTSSWVPWVGGKCARFYSENDTGLYLLRVVDYFCWESISGAQFPIQIHASQKKAPNQPEINLDSEMIEPVIGTLKVQSIPQAQLALWEKDKSNFCVKLKENYDERKPVNLLDDLDQRRTVRFLNNCGYVVSSPVGIESWKDIFFKNGLLIGRPMAGDQTIRELPYEEFTELKSKLLSLRLLQGERPDAKILGPSGDGSRTVVKLRLSGHYEGIWYAFPPSYSKESGIGFRNDSKTRQVIDVFLWDGGIPLGTQIITDKP